MTKYYFINMFRSCSGTNYVDTNDDGENVYIDGCFNVKELAAKLGIIIEVKQ